MKGERAKKVFLYFWRILVIVLLNVMILLMLWISGAAYALSKYGSTGDEVTQIQTKLQQLGYYSGDLDGIFGTGTKNAVLAFQRDQGLDADGIAGKILFPLWESPRAEVHREATADSVRATSTCWQALSLRKPAESLMRDKLPWVPLS